MLSTVSGHHFAGHLVPPPTMFPPAPPTGASLYYEMQYGSYPTGTGVVIKDLSGNGWDLTAASTMNGWPTSVNYTSTDPKSMRFGSYTEASTAFFPAGMFMLSKTVYKAVSFWFKPAVFYNNGLSNMLTMADSGTSDGIYMGTAYDGRMFVTTNGQSYNNVQQTPNIVLTLNTWQMVTYVYIADTVQPSRLYINDTEVFSFVHGLDFINSVPIKLRVFMTAGYSSQWNDLQMFNNGYTAANVSARFAATRGYYGV
jgi:hypothetical protein